MAPPSLSTTAAAKGTGSETNPSPDSVMIDLTGEDDSPVQSHLDGVRKRLKNEGEVAAIQEPNKKIKAEPSDQKNSPQLMYETDGVEVVCAPTIMDAIPAEEDTTGTNTTDVQVIATKNHTALPHMRQHCTVYPFTHAGMGTNIRFCDMCYCYICDVPASKCRGWEVPHLHCMATDTGPSAPMYLAQRIKHKDDVKKREAVLKNLPKCRYCQSPVLPSKNDAVSCNKATCLDWCRTCGRVALEKDLGKNQARLVKPSPEKEILLGTVVVPFTVHTHDPRSMVQYKKSWAAKGGQPGWTVDPQAEAREFFMHRIGPRPKIKTIVETISCHGLNSIPSDGFTRKKKVGAGKYFADETEAVILKEPEDVDIFCVLANFQSFVKGFVHASFDEIKREGTFAVSVYIVPSPQQCVPIPDYLMLRIVAAIHKIPPVLLSELRLTLSARPLQQRDPNRHRCIKPKDTEKAAVKEFNQQVEATTQNLYSLDSGVQSPDCGGISPDTIGFKSIMVRFMRELLLSNGSLVRQWGSVWSEGPDEKPSFRLPRMQVPDFHYDSPQIDCMSDPFGRLMGFKDKQLIGRTISSIRELSKTTASLNGLMENMVNRGHSSSAYVDGLAVELLPFQQQSLQWCYERETTLGGVQSFHWAVLPKVTGRSTDLYYNPALCMFSTKKPSIVRGGIIAEQMGLGKTVISLALILKNPAPESTISCSHARDIPKDTNVDSVEPFRDPSIYNRHVETDPLRGSIVSHGTLVICNVSLVGQWVAEAKSKLKDPGMVYSYHGSGRQRKPEVLARKSIVVTTYETLSSDDTYQRNKSGDIAYCPPCEQVRWWRIICDESHNLRSSSGKLAAVMQLDADNKWLVSGTPINTSTADLGNQFKFLGLDHVGPLMSKLRSTMYSFVNDRSSKDDHDSGSLSHGLGNFNFIVRPILMRHIQGQKYSGTDTTLMSLPPKSERSLFVNFTDAERQEYDVFNDLARQQYLNLRSGASHQIGKHYLKIQAMMTNARLACAGGRIPLERETRIETEEGEAKKKAPVEYSKFAFMSKFNALVVELKKNKESDTTSKSLVFSQFTSTLHWLEEELPRHGFQFRKLSGSMSMVQRTKALHDFQNDPPTTVFLLSLRAGAVGINLTQANRIFLMEPSFNPATEEQAIGRVWRLGQKRPVEIIRLLVTDSIETRMRTVIERKYTKTQNGDSQGHTSSVALGSLKDDKPSVLLEEYDELFGVEKEAAAMGLASRVSAVLVAESMGHGTSDTIPASAAGRDPLMSSFI